jgi:septal ring factor EnvC (AmiA/AmiB activator)
VPAATAATAAAPTFVDPSGLPLIPTTPSAFSPQAALLLEKRLATLDHDIDAAKAELALIGPKRLAAAARIKSRGRALYRMMRAGFLPLGGGFSAFVDHAQRVERQKRLIRADLAEETKLLERGKTLATSLEGWTKERAEVADKKALVDAAKIAIDEEKRRREAFERAFGTSAYDGPKPKNDGEIVVYGPTGKAPLESLESGSFRSRKGRLTFPVGGQTDTKPTSKEGGPAVEIKSTLGAVVRAVHAGRVAFADRYGTYGQLVILDHGDRCYTVSANLGTADVKVGDEVSAGEKIGTVGDDGRGPSLYFEVRIDNVKVSPTVWLGL